MKLIEKLPRGTMAALQRAVDAMAEWRGAHTHDEQALAEFDAELAAARQALKLVRKQSAAVSSAVNAAEAAMLGAGTLGEGQWRH